MFLYFLEDVFIQCIPNVLSYFVLKINIKQFICKSATNYMFNLYINSVPRQKLGVILKF